MILVCVVWSSKKKNTKIIANESSVEWKKSVQGDEKMMKVWSNKDVESVCE